MCGRSASALTVLLSLAFSVPASARKQDFFSGSPFGLGLIGGAESRPVSPFAAGTQATSSPYARYFAAEPFVDLGNVSLRLHAGWHFYPLVSGSGSDSSGTFGESSDAGSLEYGGRLLLAPFLGLSGRSRIYLAFGANVSIVKARNTRTYLSGSMSGQANVERLQGSGLELNGGVGFEVFLVQNYSLQIEAGYADRSIGSFKYKTSTDVSLTPRADGEEALDPATGRPKGFHSYTPYLQLGLSLNL